MMNSDELIAFSEEFGKGIGHRTRFKMLILLSQEPCTVGEIAERLRISQPTASQHLKLLKAGKLISGDKRGQHMYYSLNYDYLVNGLKQIVVSLESKSEKKEIE